MAAVFTLNSVNVTNQVDFNTVDYEENAGALNAIFRCTLFQGPGDPVLDVLERYELTVFDGANHYFGGILTSIEPTQVGLWTYYACEFADFTALSDTRIVTSGATTAGQLDNAIIQMAWTYRTDVDRTTYVPNLSSFNFPAMDFTGQTIRQVTDYIAKFVGAVWWVDADKKLHFTVLTPGEKVAEGDFERSGGSWGLAATISSVPVEGNYAGHALKHIGNGTVSANLTTQTIAATATQKFIISIDGKCTVANNWVAYISWRNGANAEISQSSFGSLTSASTWTRLWTIVAAPANTTYAIVTLKLSSNASTATGWWDNASVALITGAVGFSDSPTESGFPVPLRAFEAPHGPRQSYEMANRLYVYGNGYSGQFEYYPGQAYLRGTVVEASVTDALVVNSTQGQQRADAFFAQYGLPRWQVNIEHQEYIRAGQVVPFVWSAQGLAQAITVTKTTGKYLGDTLYLTSQLGGDVKTTGGVGALIAAQGAAIGATSSVVFDTIPPNTPTGFALVTSIEQSTIDGTPQPNATASWAGNTESDFNHYEVQLAEDAGFTTLLQSASTRSLLQKFGPLVANVVYYCRVRAVDWSNNASAWAAALNVTAAKDTTAPAIPTGLYAISGFRGVGVSWVRNGESDLSKYQVRYATNLSGAPDPSTWVRVDSKTTAMFISGLNPGTLYYFQVRAIDTSRNVVTSSVDATALDADAFPDAGWSNGTGSYITATPTQIGQADIAANSIVANMISTAGLDAGIIKTGTLLLGGVGSPTYMLVYNTSGIEIGRWSSAGLLLKDPAKTSNQMQLVNGVLQFSSDSGATWSTAISASGIKADSIVLGSFGGGHNSVPNSSFELTAFTTLVSHLWTVTGDWAAAAPTAFGRITGLDVNVDTSTANLQLTTATY